MKIDMGQMVTLGKSIGAVYKGVLEQIEDPGKAIMLTAVYLTLSMNQRKGQDIVDYVLSDEALKRLLGEDQEGEGK